MVEALEDYFNQLNLEVKLFFTNLTNEIIYECSKDPNLYLCLICAQMILIKHKQGNRDELKELPKDKYILYQCEQYNQLYIPKLDIKLIENCYAIFDYSTINLQYYPDHLREKVKLLAPLIKEPQFKVIDSQEIYVKKFVSNIINNVVKNYKDELKIEENQTNNEESNNQITILFIGLLNVRREKILNELKNYNSLNNLNYVIKIVNNVFGDELVELIKKSKIVINLHYYPNAILEIFRIHDLLPYDCKILSENPGNEEEMNLIEKYGNVVSFFPVINDELSNIDNMYKLISDNLTNEIDLVERKKFIEEVNQGNNELLFNCVYPKINILIRNTYRPAYFKKCIDSIINQTYKNYKLIMCYDDDDCLEYLEQYKNNNKIEIFKAEDVDKNSQAFYNLYCNQLLDRVKDGWIIFLDDDDILTLPDTIQNIENNLNNINDFLFWKVKLGPRIVYPKDIYNIELNFVSGIGFCFHSKFKDLARWDYNKGSDYRFITKLLAHNIFNRKFVDKILTGIQHTHKMGFLGRKEVKNIDILFLTNIIHNKNLYREFFFDTNKKIVNKKQQILLNNNQNSNFINDLDINNTKLGLCMCIHNRYKLTKLCLQYLNSLSFEKIIVCYSEDFAYNNLNEFHNNKKFFFVKSDNYPISLKWNNCIKASKQFNFDGIMILGDDDIIDKKYINYCKLYLENKYDYITNNHWYYLIIEDKMLASFRYIKRKELDGLGAGRVISKRILELYDYNIYNFNLNKNLDGNSFNMFYKSITKIHYTDEYFVYCLTFSDNRNGISINGSMLDFFKNAYGNSSSSATCDKIEYII